MSKWTDFVKAFATKNGMSYGCALSTVECKTEYAKANPKPEKVPKVKVPKEKKKTKKELQAELGKLLSKPHFAPAGGEIKPIFTSSPEGGSITMSVEELKSKRGRPKKYATPEEAKVAKTVASVASNKRQKAIKQTVTGEGVSAKNLSHGVTGEGLIVTPQGDKIYPLTIGQVVKLLNTKHP